MQQVINLKKKKRQSWTLWRQLIIIAISVIVSSVGIKAADTMMNRSEDKQDKCPEDMVEVVFPQGNFCIDKYEASAGENCPDRDPQSALASKDNLDKNSCAPVSVSGASPWRFISQNQASLACARAGKRLATNREWQQAALGTSDYASNWQPNDCQLANNWAAQPGLTGSADKCVSLAGAFDMVGNLWEWTDGTVYEGQFENKILPDQGYVKAVSQEGLPSETGQGPSDDYYSDYMYLKKSGTRAIARGGYWNSKEQGGVYSAYIVSLPSYAEAGIGFRCVK